MDSGARIGPGKAALLESVHSTGSISAAARSMGMDYKRAWLLVDSLNRAFVTPAIERSAGGLGGGGAALTPFGQELLERYRRLEAGAAALAKSDLRKMPGAITALLAASIPCTVFVVVLTAVAITVKTCWTIAKPYFKGEGRLRVVLVSAAAFLLYVWAAVPPIEVLLLAGALGAFLPAAQT